MKKLQVFSLIILCLGFWGCWNGDDLHLARLVALEQIELYQGETTDGAEFTVGVDPSVPGSDITIIATQPNQPEAILESECRTMNELEASMAQLLELAKNNPDSLFRIWPNEARTKWTVEFTKGNLWWAAWPEGDETLSDAIQEALPYFDSLTDEIIQKRRDEMLETKCKH